MKSKGSCQYLFKKLKKYIQNFCFPLHAAKNKRCFIKKTTTSVYWPIQDFNFCAQF